MSKKPGKRDSERDRAESISWLRAELAEAIQDRDKTEKAVDEASRRLMHVQEVVAALTVVIPLFEKKE